MHIRTHALALAIAATFSMTSALAQTAEQELPTQSTGRESSAQPSQPLQQNMPADSATPGMADSSAAPTAGAIDDQKIKQFASAYAEVATIQQNASNQLQTANEPGKAEEVKANAESQMIAAVERNGLNVDEFNQIVTAMASDQNVRSRVAAELQDRSSGPAAPTE